VGRGGVGRGGAGQGWLGSQQQATWECRSPARQHAPALLQYEALGMQGGSTPPVRACWSIGKLLLVIPVPNHKWLLTSSTDAGPTCPYLTFQLTAPSPPSSCAPCRRCGTSALTSASPSPAAASAAASSSAWRGVATGGAHGARAMGGARVAQGRCWPVTVSRARGVELLQLLAMPGLLMVVWSWRLAGCLAWQPVGGLVAPTSAALHTKGYACPPYPQMFLGAAGMRRPHRL